MSRITAWTDFCANKQLKKLKRFHSGRGLNPPKASPYVWVRQWASVWIVCLITTR